jgi:peroxiredoxin
MGLESLGRFGQTARHGLPAAVTRYAMDGNGTKRMDEDRVAEPLVPGEAAPDFVLPAISREGEVGLRDYRDRSPVLVGLFRGVYCAFCRRQLAQLDSLGRDLQVQGIETLAVVTSTVERARLYFKYRKTGLMLASDPAMSVHAAFRLPRSEVTEAPMQWPHTINLEQASAIRVNPWGELPEAVPLPEAGPALDRKDGFEYQPGDSQDAESSWNQLGGLFLIDPAGLVRWRNVEAEEGPGAVTGAVDRDGILAAIAGMGR